MTDNPPAFPRPSTANGTRQDGMSLRDWFAGQALAGFSSRETFDPGQAKPEQRARLAYIEADAMLAERMGK